MTNVKNKLADIKNLLDQCSMNVAIYSQICDILDDVSDCMYGIKEDYKRILANNRSLETRYSEMMKLLRDIRRSQLEL